MTAKKNISSSNFPLCVNGCYPLKTNKRRNVIAYCNRDVINIPLLIINTHFPIPSSKPLVQQHYCILHPLKLLQCFVLLSRPQIIEPHVTTISHKPPPPPTIYSQNITQAQQQNTSCIVCVCGILHNNRR